MPEIAESATSLTLADVDRLIQVRICPIPLTFTYRAGLLGVTAGLISLQLAYLAMIALAIAAAVAYVLIAVPALIATIHVNLFTLVLIVGPFLVLSFVAHFLYKPLLAPRAVAPEQLELKREEAPVLFAWVERICSAIGSPPPRRILINLDVNASASLAPGWRGFLANDLTLTIGLPLLNGLTLKQFSGVLAHEFGHFSQTIGMRLYFTINMIRHWFLRVAYERDKYDEMLESLSRSGDWRVRLVTKATKSSVAFSRWVLRGLQHVATWISARFSRQMEFDADRHEAALVGGEVSATTYFRLAMLGLASQEAWQDVDKLWASKHRTADFTALLSFREGALTDGTRQEITDNLLGQTTDRWATHPCTSERIRNVEGVVGLISEPLDQPAHVLIENYSSVCERATEHRYKLSAGDERLKLTQLSTAESVAQIRVATERLNAFRIVFGFENRPWRWFRLPPADQPPADEQVTYLRLDPDRRYWTWLETSLKRFAGMEYVRSGGKIRPAGFSLTHADLAGIETEVLEARKQIEEEAAKNRDCYGRNAHLLSKSEPELRSAYEALTEVQEPLLELRHQYQATAVLLENLQRLPSATGAIAREASLARLRKTALQIIRKLDTLPSPLKPDASLASHLFDRPPADAPQMDAQSLGAAVLDGSDQLAEELLAEWCVRSAAQNSSPSQPLADAEANASAADTAN